MAEPDAQILLHEDDADAPWGESLVRRAAEARRIAEQRLGLAVPGIVHIRTFEHQAAFHRYLQSRPTHVVAVALPHTRRIVIYRPAWRAAGPDEQDRTLIHEMVHLILGWHIEGNLPAWLEEGLAQIVAGQQGRGRWRLMAAGGFGTLIPLTELQRLVAMGGESQSLAYAQSISVTEFLLRRRYPGESSDGRNPAPLVRDLAHPGTGPNLLRRFWDPNFIMALEVQWKQSRRGAWSWVAILSGTGVLWGFTSLLFLLAYWRKRRMAQLKRERFAEEEARDRELGLGPLPYEYEAEVDPDAEEYDFGEDEPEYWR